MLCMFYMVYHLYISNAPAPKTVHSKSNTTTKIAAPNFMRVFYHKSPPSAYPPTTGGRSREAGAMRGANPPPETTTGFI